MVELFTTVYSVPLMVAVSPTVATAHLQVPPSKYIVPDVVVVEAVVELATA